VCADAAVVAGAVRDSTAGSFVRGGDSLLGTDGSLVRGGVSLLRTGSFVRGGVSLLCTVGTIVGTGSFVSGWRSPVSAGELARG
jgi:hypothetical protein